ncbi:hypothetical protein BDZ89DRAFT_951635 [Hymenopellis radicata]|nr:hypothetical protein BDZ89DRAFT_951635 [Hymenopellis radicata]
MAPPPKPFWVKKDGNKKEGAARSSRKEIADDTLKAIETGCFVLKGVKHDLKDCTARSCRSTRYYAPNSLLSTWQRSPSSPPHADTEISILQMTTLEGARYFSSMGSAGKIAVLNFASAKKPGGGFLGGASAQEESIARSSNLYPSLMTDTGQEFYHFHKKDPKQGFYSHAIIYTPSVSLFRDDNGTWVEPIEVDIVTSAAVNAGTLRDHYEKNKDKDKPESEIEVEMKERMGRILFMCESSRAKNLVLGSFGTGVFRNKVDLVAKLWADLLVVPDARFKHSFERVVFAIIDQRTVDKFQTAFDARKEELATTKDGPSSESNMIDLT